MDAVPHDQDERPARAPLPKGPRSDLGRNLRADLLRPVLGPRRRRMSAYAPVERTIPLPRAEPLAYLLARRGKVVVRSPALPRPRGRAWRTATAPGGCARGVRIIPDQARPACGSGFPAHPTGKSTPPLAPNDTAPGPSPIVKTPGFPTLPYPLAGRGIPLRGLVKRPPPRLATRRALDPDSTVENVVGGTVSCGLACLVLGRRLGLGLL
jgi:hypothetical protein